MKNKSISLYVGGASILYGALIFLFVYRKNHLFTESIFTALVFATILFLVVLLLQIKVVKKLNVFSGFTSVFLQGFLYVLASAFALLSAFIFYTVYSTSSEQFESFLFQGTIRGIIYILTLPFVQEKYLHFLPWCFWWELLV